MSVSLSPIELIGHSISDHLKGSVKKPRIWCIKKQ